MEFILFNNKTNGVLLKTYKPNGDIRYTLDGKLHREDGPAVLEANGTQKWYRNGRLYREDGPAVIDFNGVEKWYRNGLVVPANSKSNSLKVIPLSPITYTYNYNIESEATIIELQGMCRLIGLGGFSRKRKDDLVDMLMKCKI